MRSANLQLLIPRSDTVARPNMPPAHPSSPGPHLTHAVRAQIAQRGIERGWERSRPEFDDHHRTRFFLCARPQKGTRTHLREKRLFCDHPIPLTKTEGQTSCKTLNHSHFPACDTRAATPPYCPRSVRVRPSPPTHQVTFIPDAICRISFRIAKPTRLGPAKYWRGGPAGNRMVM
jgi:hypothetical protein